MAGIIMENITKIYPVNFKVIENLSLEVKDKEFMILVGPSGCGKSTLLRIIAGLENISAGKIYIGDKDVTDIEPKDRNISMVFQNYAIYPHLTVYENMALPLQLRKIDKKDIKNKIKNIAEVLEIQDLLNKKPDTISGGQKQRVALGRAIIREPEVFLFDEPLSNLDAKLRSSMRIELIRLHKQIGTTFVYVTHDQVEAMTMADRIVVMKDGVIQQIDTPKNLYKHPKNIFSAGFIGTPQMNFIKTEKGMMGIRPEKLMTSSGINEDINLTEIVLFKRAQVEAIELLGAEKIVYFDVNNLKLVSKISEEKDIEIGEYIDLYAENKDVHWFE